VKETTEEPLEVPVWAREDAFPEAPEGWGWCDTKGQIHPCESLDSLTTAIRDDPDGRVILAWTPARARMRMPEELDGMGDALRTARARWTLNDLDHATHKLRRFGMVLLAVCGFKFYGGLVVADRLAAQYGAPVDTLERVSFATEAMLGSTLCGLTLLFFLIFALIPWYQARKRRADLAKWTTEGIAESVPTLRFEVWLDRQKAPLTRLLLGLVTLVGLAQIFSHFQTAGLGSLMALFHNWDGTLAAGLLKDRYLQGEWWRLFTAPFLHGNIVHFLMNASAFAYLGKRVEVFARWPHLPLVFLFAAGLGGEASVRFVAAPSVGASGGLMGLLGFLLVFETLHSKLVPRKARRRLAAGVVLTAVVGVVGFRYIDNAAHAGGLLAGMIYAAIVFPASSSPARPRSTTTDRIAGSLALLVLSAAALLAIWRIFGIGSS
jgi:membrane associated rhomboid family serine protease